MGEVRATKLRPVNEGNRAIHLAERPRGVRQIDHRGDARVQAEAESQIVVAAGFEQGQGALQVIPSLAILAGEPAGDPGGAMGDAGFGRLGFRRDVVEEGGCVRPHRRQFASDVAADP